MMFKYFRYLAPFFSGTVSFAKVLLWSSGGTPLPGPTSDIVGWGDAAESEVGWGDAATSEAGWGN